MARRIYDSLPMFHYPFPFLDSEEAVLPDGLGPNWERGVDSVLGL